MFNKPKPRSREGRYHDGGTSVVVSTQMGGVKFPRDIATGLLERMETTGTWAMIREQERTALAMAADNRIQPFDQPLDHFFQ